MANKNFTDLVAAGTALATDVYAIVQGGATLKLTASQLLDFARDNIVLNYAGDPNGNVEGTEYQLLIDTVSKNVYICTTSGSATTAVWTLVSQDLGSMTDGQLLIGNSSTGIPDKATLTAGSGIVINNGAGSIQVSATPMPFPYTVVTGTSATMTTNTGYIPDNASQVTLTLPTTATVGSHIEIVGKGAGGWKIAQSIAGQHIHIGPTTSTPGLTGYVESTNQYDSLALICVEADTHWSILGGAQGNLNVV